MTAHRLPVSRLTAGATMTDFIISQIQAQSGLGLLCLVAVFFYVGLITIGGGQVGITVMQQILVIKEYTDSHSGRSSNVRM